MRLGCCSNQPFAIKKMEKLKFIDLFAGCGGLSKGLEEAGFECEGFVEFWQPAIDTHLKNCGGKLIGRDITQIKDEEIEQYKGKIEIVCGGPPCQGFSMAGKRDPNDVRNRLFEEFVRFVRVIKPNFFIMENVASIGSMKNPIGELVIKEIFKAFMDIGYQLQCKILNTSNYGVPETRRRAIFIGTKTEKEIYYPKFQGKVFLKEILNLPYEQVPEIQHIYDEEATKKNYRFSYVKEGGNYGLFKSNYKKLKSDGFSCTITKSGRYIHPVYNRLLSVREEARIQSFPDDFMFCGNVKEMYMQIGNAVAVKMAKAIGETLKEI